MRTLSIFFAVVFLSTPTLFDLVAQPDLDAAKVDRNVVFGMYSGLALVLDVYYPHHPNGYGIVHVSGSGWTRPLSLDAPMLNHQNHVKLEGAALVKAGYTLFSVNHRAVPRFIYPDAVHDVQRAVRFIRHHAQSFGIDSTRIGAVGGSSGGHLVSMLGTLDGEGLMVDRTPVNLVSAKVQCVIARAAPSDFLGSDLGRSFLGVRSKELENSKTIEYTRAYDASPIHHVSADDAPCLFIHGDQDNIVPISLSERMLKEYERVGVPAKLMIIEGAGHGPSFPGALEKPDLGDAYVQWMDRHLIRH